MAENNNPSNQSNQFKTTTSLGLKKDVSKTILKDGESHHIKNGITSSREGDLPYVQNAPSNFECADLPDGYHIIGSVFIIEQNRHILFLVDNINNHSEIGSLENCKYTSLLNNDCLNFNVNYPIKSEYKISNCELKIYFQDKFNRDRRINLDDIPYEQEIIDGCLTNKIPLTLDCAKINIQNDLRPPVIEVESVGENGGLYSGSYQFAISYANINGFVQSSYYSKTNIVPIYEDQIGAYDTTQGSKQNILTGKSINLRLRNLDTRYDYVNIAVIKTIQGSPTYEKVATIPVSSTSYTYTGRELTTLLSFDELVGLYPDYSNSGTITSANNYLIRANMSTEDEANYQPFVNLIELDWVAIRMNADTTQGSYKEPTNTTNYEGYMRGEIYPLGIRLLLTNGRKTSSFPFIGREATPIDRITYTDSDYTNNCDLFEFSGEGCDDQPDSLEKWQVYDTSSVYSDVDDTSGVIDECWVGPVARGDFSYWESEDTYPCNEEVWGDPNDNEYWTDSNGYTFKKRGVAGQPIRHFKFPSNETFHIHNGLGLGRDVPYGTLGDPIDIEEEAAYKNTIRYIYPMGIQLRLPLERYIIAAVQLGILTQEEADLIEGYEIIRGDRTNQKSVIAKGLLYNMRYYEENNPTTGADDKYYFPNYPYNDLREDPYLRESDDGCIQDPGGILFDENTSGGDITIAQATTWTGGDPLDASLTNITIPAAWAGVTLDLSVSSDTDLVIPDGTIISAYFETCTEGAFTSYSMTLEFAHDTATVPDPITIFDNNYNTFPDPPKNTNYTQDRFTFHSPDTHFRQPFPGSYIINHVETYGVQKGKFVEVEGHPELRPSPKNKSVNMALQFVSESNYNNFLQVANGQRRRLIDDYGYLYNNAIAKFPRDTTGDQINNSFRESSLALKIALSACNPTPFISDPSVEDQSRYTMGSQGLCDCHIKVENKASDKKDAYKVNTACTEDYSWISSYYVSLNVKAPKQYGQINSIIYLGTGKYFSKSDPVAPVFGGDTFITRFTLKRKHAFFRVNFIDADAFGIDYKNQSSGAKAIYYLKNTNDGTLGAGTYVVDYKKSNLDCDTGTKEKKQRNGFIYLFSIGIPNFYVESTVNTELRYSDYNVWDKWYPTLRGTTLNKWTQHRYYPIEYDNTYLYNFNYSKQNSEDSLFPQALDFDPDSQCKNTHPSRIIYSKQSNADEISDFWTINLANDYYDADSNLGAITDIRKLDNFKVLVRYENGAQVFNAYDTLTLDSTLVTVGTGGMFANRPQSFGETDTGFAGSRSKWAINTSQAGTFYVDEKRKRIYLYGSNLEEISNTGMFNWFNNNLGLKFADLIQSLSNLPNVDKFNLDNPFWSVGFTSVYDTRFNLWFLTKKDYELVNPAITLFNGESRFSFDKDGVMKIFDGGKKYIDIDFTDSSVWKDVGWTIAYSPIYKAWISFFDFKPNYYLADNNKFFSGLWNTSIYQHWSEDKFQRYYGTLYPFEVMISTANEGQASILHSIEYYLKIQKYTGSYFQDIFENQNINFNKLIVSTDNQSSGNLNLIPFDKTRPYEMIKYPLINPNSADIIFNKVEGHKYRVNQFIDIVKDKTNNLPIFNISDNGVDISVNDSNMDYNKINNMSLGNQKFRNEFFDIILIQDNTDAYKFILKYLINKTLKSIR